MNTISHIRKPRPVPKYEIEIVGKCPCCGQDVAVGTSRYYCTCFHYKSKDFRDTIDNQCMFAINRNHLKKLGKDEITPDEMRTLLEGKAIRLEGLIRKDGTSFDTYGVLGTNPKYGWNINFVSLSALAKPTPTLQTPQKRRIVIHRSRRLNSGEMHIDRENN